MKLKIWIVTLFLLILVTPLAVHAQEIAWNGTHTVQPGETLLRIGLRYGVSVNALATANGIINPNLIFAGQVLRVPSGNVPAPQPGPQPGQPFDVTVPANTNVYEAQSFESRVRYVLPTGTASAVGRSPESAWIWVRSGYGV